MSHQANQKVRTPIRPVSVSILGGDKKKSLNQLWEASGGRWHGRRLLPSIIVNRLSYHWLNAIKHQNDIQIAKIYHTNEQGIVIENTKIEFQHSKVFLSWAVGAKDMFQIIILIQVPVRVPMYQPNSKFRCHFLHIKTRLDQGEIIWRGLSWFSSKAKYKLNKKQMLV